MHFLRWRAPWLGLLLVGLLLCTCDLNQPLTGPQPKPEQVALQPTDLPVDLQRCPSSGPVDGYLRDLKAKAASGYQSAQGAWTQLKGEGAAAGAVAVYGTNAVGCSAQLGAALGRTAACLVAAFNDSRAAGAAYQRGTLGFPTPAAGQQVHGLAQGVATGLSENSWTVQRDVDGRRIYVAWWQERAFTVFFVSADLDLSESQRAAAAIESRIR